MPTLRQLQAFKAVMESRSISRAADALHLTQPAVSKLIQSLEAECGLRLFERQRQRVLPTAEAHLYLDEAENLFLNLSRLGRLAEDLKAMVHTKLTIACYPALAIDLMPQVLNRFQRQNPGAASTLLIRSSPRLSDMAIAQQFDLGISMLPVNHPDVISVPLLRENLVVLMPPGHHLAGREELRPRDLEGEEFVSMGHDDRLSYKIDEYFLKAGVTRRIVGRVALAAAVCGFVRDGAGVSLVGPLTATGPVAAGVKVARLRPPIHTVSNLLIPKLRPASAIRDQFLAYLRGALAEPLPEVTALDWEF
nr:LysR substrate-binding domain-containing protein [Szabonella alba]